MKSTTKKTVPIQQATSSQRGVTVSHDMCQNVAVLHLILCISVQCKTLWGRFKNTFELLNLNALEY